MLKLFIVVQVVWAIVMLLGSLMNAEDAGKPQLVNYICLLYGIATIALASQVWP